MVDMQNTERFPIQDTMKWFYKERYGLFIHWGPASVYGGGEQVMFREHLDVKDYEQKACEWNPEFFDAKLWADIARKAGMKYVCLTTRHHDGYCLWDSQYTDYTSARQAPGRDFLREFVDAFRAAGIRIGLYYSWLDWRIPAFFEGPEINPEGFRIMRDYMHNQVIELMTHYGKIDLFFFDGVWPRNPDELGTRSLIKQMRRLQPEIIINNHLGNSMARQAQNGASYEDSLGAYGDFSVSENQISADTDRLWLACQVSTWRLWGWCDGERWRSSDQLLDMLCDCAVKGTNRGGSFLLNVGPQADGQFPPPFVERVLEIGRWLQVHGEAVFDTDGANITEFITRGRQTTSGNNLYLIIRFWNGKPELRLADLVTPVKKVTLLTTGQDLLFTQTDDILTIKGLPVENPSELFPVIKVECADRPAANQWGREKLWTGDPLRIARWARERGTDSVNTAINVKCRQQENL